MNWTDKRGESLSRFPGSIQGAMRGEGNGVYDRERTFKAAPETRNH
jgi:hypothetical protein